MSGFHHHGNHGHHHGGGHDHGAHADRDAHIGCSADPKDVHAHQANTGGSSRSRLGFAALLTGLFMVVEVVGGVLSGSLALLADAGHMLTDFAALFMAWAAFAVMGRGPTSRLSFGWGRLSILVAFVNGLTLFAVAGWIVFEAYHRLLNPGEVLGGPMLLVAIAGLFVNIAVLLILLGGDRENLNMRGAILHVMGDMLGSLAAIIAAVIILQTGFMLADPILSVLVALLILRSAWGLVRETGLILMEGVPRGVEVEAVRADLSEHVEGLSELTDIHSWAITPDQPMATVLAVAEEGKDRDVLRAAIKSRLAERFGVRHAIVEVSGG